MAEVGSQVLTLPEINKRLDPDFKLAPIVEILANSNSLVSALPMKQGNLDTGEQFTVRTSLPDVYWRKANQGVAVSKSTTSQVTQRCGQIEGWSEVDKDIADIGGRTNDVRMSEAKPFIEAIAQEAEDKLFGGDTGTNPEQIDGLSKVYAASTGATTSQNVISAGGAGADNMSIYFLGLGENSIYGFYPKGTPVGIYHKDWGEQVIETVAGVAGSRMAVYQDQFKFNVGLAVKDWRNGVRIANIDLSALQGGSGADLIKYMSQATHRPKNLKSATFKFFMNRSTFQYLDEQAYTNVKAGGGLTYENVDGAPVYKFRGFEVVVTDALGEAEAAI